MNKRRIIFTIFMTIVILAVSLVPVSVFARYDDEGVDGTSLIKSSIDWNLGHKVVDSGNTTTNTTGGVNIAYEETLDIDRRGSIDINLAVDDNNKIINYSINMTGDTEVFSSADRIKKEYVEPERVMSEDKKSSYLKCPEGTTSIGSGTTLQCFREMESPSNTYMVTEDGNVRININESEYGNPLFCEIKTATGTSIDDYNASLEDCAQKLNRYESSDTQKQFGEVSVKPANGDKYTKNEGNKTTAAQGESPYSANEGLPSGGGSSSGDGEEGDDSVCYDNSGPLGWVICPVLHAISSFASTIYKDIAENYLKVEAGEILKSGGPTYIAWSSFRDIANIAFVIGLLAVIISQLTGYGIDNYGIKRMLPRLIVAAILVNLSFFICQIVVDLANVAGASIGGILSPSTLGISPANSGKSVDEFAYGVSFLFLGGGGIFLAINFIPIISAIGIAGVIMCLLSVLSAIISILFLWFILIARQAVIVILVIISPLALVAYLFPNTENLAKRYIKAATGALMLYPLCEFLVNGGQLAGVILANVSQSTGEDSLALIAMIVQVAPFFAIPSLLKSSLNGIGNLGAKISDIGNNARGRFDGFRKSDFVQDGVVTSANSHLERKINAIDKIAKRPGGKFLADTLNRRQRRYIKREADTLGGQLSLKSEAARLQLKKDPKYQARADKAGTQQVLRENAENWASYYEDDGVNSRQRDFVGAMGKNEQSIWQQDSGQIEGIISAYMKDEDYGGLQKAMKTAETSGASDEAMARAAKAMKDNSNYGKMSDKKPSLGEWAKNPTGKFSKSMADNVSSFKPKDWATMDGDERKLALTTLDSLKTGDAQAQAAYAEAVKNMQAAINNPTLNGSMTAETADAYRKYGSPLQQGAGQDFSVNGDAQGQVAQDAAKNALDGVINAFGTQTQGYGSTGYSGGASSAPISGGGQSTGGPRQNITTVNVENVRKLGKAARGEQISNANQVRGERFYNSSNTTGDGKNTVFITGNPKSLDLSPKTPPTKNT